MKRLLNLADKGLIPDPLIKMGIHYLCYKRLQEIKRQDPEMSLEKSLNLLREHEKYESIAIETEAANSQHYEIPPKFFELVLGQNLKYSCSIFPNTNSPLTVAENHTLGLYTKRAEIDNNQDILDLGCGWGSLSFFIAKQFPSTNVTAVSNSKDQIEYITNKCKQSNINNITAIKQDVNSLVFDKKFDRVVSIEMMEHVKNHMSLFEKISSWLNDDGKLFIHIFTNIMSSYDFIPVDDSDWMSKHFFSGGMMPADNYLLYHQKNLKIDSHWRVNGKHYEQTSKCWLENMDKNKEQILSLFKEVYKDEYITFFHRWRIFFMSCEKLFGYNKGREWMVSHYLFKK